MRATRSQLCRRLAVVLAVALLAGCPGGDTPPPPQVNLSAMPTDVRAALEERLREVDERPEDAAARAALGLAFEANALPEAAAETLRQAVTLEPGEPRWHYHLSRVLTELDLSDESLAELDAAIHADPGYAPAKRVRGERLFALGRLDEAETAFRDAVRLANGDVGAHLGLVRVALQRGDHEQALEILEPLVARQPDAGYLRRVVADAHRQAGRLELARAELERAGDDKAPGWHDPWADELERYRVGYAADLKRAMRLVDERRFDQAIPQLEALRRLRPDDVTLLTNLGAAYIDTRRLNEGVAALREALTHEPDHFGAHLNLASALERAGRIESALEHVDQAIASNPGLGDAHLLRGRLLVRRKRLEEAIGSFERAARSSPQETTPLVFIGWVRAQRGEWAPALEAFSSATAIDAKDGAAQLGLALALAETGDLAGGRRALTLAEQYSPTEPQMPIVRKRIAELERGG